MIWRDISDRCDGRLDSLRPCGDSKIMWFVHDAEDDIRIVRVFGSEGRPQRRELIIRGTALADDAAIPTGVVMDVEDTLGARVEAARHEVIVLAKIRGVQIATHDIVREVLPAHCDTKHVKIIVAGKMLHLCCPRGGECGARHGTCSVGGTAKV